MALWGRNDQAVTANSVTTVESTTGAPIGTYALVKGDQITRVDGANAHFGNTSPGTRALVDSTMFNNVTMGAFVANLAVGVFGVDAGEAGVTTGNLALTYVTFGGSGYKANAVVTLTLANGTTNATAVNAFANVTAGSINAGRITSLKIAQAGATYAVSPTAAIAAPAAHNIPANTTTIPVTIKNLTVNATGFSNSSDTILITSANSTFTAGDRVYYTVPAGNTALAPLTGNSYYYVSFANTSAIKLANTAGGANINITDARDEDPAEVHTLTTDGSFIKISTANSYWQANDRFYYTVPTNNTAFGNLTSNSYYYISFANTTGVKISSTQGGANLLFGAAAIPVAGSPETHTFTGDTATGYVVVNGGKHVTHAGWVLRTEGQGGRAGRVQYETLVAMGSLGAQTAAYGTPATVADASDDTIIPDGA